METLEILSHVESCFLAEEVVTIVTCFAKGKLLDRFVWGEEDGLAECLTGSIEIRIDELVDSTRNRGLSVSVHKLSLGGENNISEVDVIVEHIRSRINLIIFGAGHVGQAVALMGSLLGYHITVIDDRKEFLSNVRLPDPRIEMLNLGFDDVSNYLQLTVRSAVVIVTSGHQYDEECLRQVIRSRAGYIGMIGSRRRVLSIFSKLQRDGFATAELERVHAPVGLRIGAKTPQEIAVSILAEIIETFSDN